MKRACQLTIGLAAEVTILAAIGLLLVPALVLAGLAYLERVACSRG